MNNVREPNVGLNYHINLEYALNNSNSFRDVLKSFAEFLKTGFEEDKFDGEIHAGFHHELTGWSVLIETKENREITILFTIEDRSRDSELFERVIRDSKDGDLIVISSKRGVYPVHNNANNNIEYSLRYGNPLLCLVLEIEKLVVSQNYYKLGLKESVCSKLNSNNKGNVIILLDEIIRQTSEG